MPTESSRGLALKLSVKQQTSREGDIEHRKKRGLRWSILNCVAVDYHCACYDVYQRQSLIQFPKMSRSHSDKYTEGTLLGAENRRILYE